MRLPTTHSLLSLRSVATAVELPTSGATEAEAEAGAAAPCSPAVVVAEAAEAGKELAKAMALRCHKGAVGDVAFSKRLRPALEFKLASGKAGRNVRRQPWRL